LTNDGKFLYYYDCDNRLIDVNNQSDEQVVSNRYDYLGGRGENIKRHLRVSETGKNRYGIPRFFRSVIEENIKEHGCCRAVICKAVLLWKRKSKDHRSS